MMRSTKTLPGTDKSLLVNNVDFSEEQLDALLKDPQSPLKMAPTMDYKDI